MKNTIPSELVTLYGTIAISRIATVQTNNMLKAMPDVGEVLKKVKDAKNTPQTKSINDLDVENGGMGQEFEDFMTAGFETLVPGAGDFKQKPFPIFDIPDSVRICGRILRGLNQAREEREIQQDAAEKLEALVSALEKNAHPLVVLFAALFKAALQEVQNRLQELDDLIAGLLRSGAANDCF